MKAVRRSVGSPARAADEPSILPAAEPAERVEREPERARDDRPGDDREPRVLAQAGEVPTGEGDEGGHPDGDGSLGGRLVVRRWSACRSGRRGGRGQRIAAGQGGRAALVATDNPRATERLTGGTHSRVSVSFGRRARRWMQVEVDGRGRAVSPELLRRLRRHGDRRARLAVSAHGQLLPQLDPSPSRCSAESSSRMAGQNAQDRCWTSPSAAGWHVALHGGSGGSSDLVSELGQPRPRPRRLLQPTSAAPAGDSTTTRRFC